MFVGGRRLLVLSVGVLAGSMMVGLPVAQSQDVEATGSAGPLIKVHTDAETAPLDLRRIQRPLTSRSAAGARVIDVHFFRSGSPWGESPLTESYARELIRQADAWADSTTEGQIRLRYASLVEAPAITSDPCGTLEPVLEVVKPFLPVTPLPGASEATWMSVTRTAGGCPFGGRGYVGFPGMWMRLVEPSYVAPVDVSTFVHELGHNLGLWHSSGYSPDPSWPLRPSDLLEYGDHADVMGWGGVWRQMAGRWIFRVADLHAHNRNLIGVLPDSSIDFVREPVEEFDIAAVGSTSGVTAVYLPWQDRSKFVIDYRPASYGDGILDFGDGSGSGVYVRLVDSGANAGPAPYTALEGTGAFTSRIGRFAEQLIHGYRPGEQVALPDGSVVQVISANDSGARVRVTRPADVTPPTLGTGVISIKGCANDPCVLLPETSKWGPRGAEYEVEIPALPVVSDDIWVSSAQLTWGDDVLQTIARVPNGRNAETARTIAGPVLRTVLPGSHTVRLEATDLSGNRSVAYANVVAPSAPLPVSEWQSFGPDVRFSFPGWDRLVRCPAGSACFGLTVEALKPCPAGIDVAIDVGGSGDRVIASMEQSTPPLAAGARHFVYLRTLVDQPIENFIYRSMTCAQTPSAPLGVSAVAGDGEARVSWQPPASDGGEPVTSYVASASPGGSSCSTTGELSCTVTGLTNETAYTFTVVAVNAVGSSVASLPSVAVTPRVPVVAPGAVRNVKVSPARGALRVMWAAPADWGGAPSVSYQYQVGRKAWKSTSATLVRVPGRKGVRITVKVRAVNGAGVGPVASASGVPR